MKKIILSLLLAAMVFTTVVNADIIKAWDVLKQGNPYLLSAEDTDEMAVYQLMFFSAEAQNNVALKVRFEPGTGQIYQKIIIEKTNMKDDLLSPASLKLKISNEWLAENLPNGSSLRLADEKGFSLPKDPIYSRKSEKYSYYAASVPMKSFYIVSGAKPAAAANKTGTDSENSTITKTPTAPTTPAAPAESPVQDNAPQAAASCTDSIKNQDETDIDCGGSCKRCEDTKACITSADCASMYCEQGICKTPTCNDGIKNQQESDVDCGGLCSKCSDSRSCVSNNDCQSGFCSQSECIALPQEKKEPIIPKNAFAFDFKKYTSFTMSDNAKQNIKIGGIAIGAIIIFALIVFFIVKKSRRAKKEPSVKDLMKLYEEIKRI